MFLISPKVSCHLREALRTLSSTSTKEISQSCLSKPPLAGEEIALKMVVQPRELTAKLLPRCLQHLSHQHVPCHIVCPSQIHTRSYSFPPSLQVAGLEEMAKKKKKHIHLDYPSRRDSGDHSILRSQWPCTA